MQKKWVVKNKVDSQIVKKLASELNIHEVLATLLVHRGITTFEGAKNFFRPQLSQLHDPFIMKGMDKAVWRIFNAIENNENILVYGDYDVDGTTAVALVYSYIKKFYKNVGFYIPDRYKEGYGISFQSLDFAYKSNYTLVIALDCGIRAVTQIEYAATKYIDVIVCDHHLPGEHLPAAVAILDPKQLDCPYPYKELSGCGIGFKLIQAINMQYQKPFSEIESYLDLVVLSIASDIVPITGENRILAYYGLKKINTQPRFGIESILKYSGVYRKPKQQLNGQANEYVFNKELTISDLVFLVGPRLNAAGRIDDGRIVVELLLSESLDLAYILGQNVDSNNKERRNLDLMTTQQALAMIKKNPELEKRKSTVLFNPDWHKGVIGIVASRLTECYYRPTIILTQNDGMVTGSARSIKDFDIHEAIDSCSDLLEHFGGHKFAAGLSLKPENLAAFEKRFENYVAQKLTDDMLCPEIDIDAQLEIADITPSFFNVLKQFAPFGPGNMSPTFVSINVFDTGYAKIVGSNHIKLTVTQRDAENHFIAAIAFQQGEHLVEILKNRPFNICYHIDENEWQGQVSLQLNVKDIRFS